MRRYWIRIALGALLVFGAGMMIAAMVDSGRERVQAVVAQVPSVFASVPEMFEPLRVDGVEVGTIARLHVGPRGEGERRMELTLSPNDSGAARLAECEALHGPIDGLFESGVECGLPEPAEEYEQFGTLVVSPAGATLPLYAPVDEVAEFQADGMDHPGEVDIRADQGQTSVKIVDAPGKERVNIEADSTGARIQVLDADGQPVFQFHADSLGVRLKARDSQ